MQVRVNGQTHRVSAPCTVAELLERLGLPDRGVAVARDRVLMPRVEWDAQIEDGWELDVVTVTAGG